MHRTVLVVVALTAGASGLLGFAVGFMAGGGRAELAISASPNGMLTPFEPATPIATTTSTPNPAATATPDSTSNAVADAEGAEVANRPLPRMGMTVADPRSGESLRVVYGASNSPVFVSPDETPAASDGTGTID